MGKGSINEQRKMRERSGRGKFDFKECTEMMISSKRKEPFDEGRRMFLLDEGCCCYCCCFCCWEEYSLELLLTFDTSAL